MSGLFIALSGIWLIAVGYHGNGTESLKFIGLQKSFIVWLIAILILWGLYQIKGFSKVIGPIALLALTTLVVKNFPIIQSEYNTILQKVTK